MKYVLLTAVVVGSFHFSQAQITPHQSKEITPYKGRDLSQENNKPAAVVNSTPGTTSGSSVSKTVGTKDLLFFIRKWKTGVTDAFYVTTTAGVQTMVVNVNARVKPLHINADGTYYWEAYGEQRRGRWTTTGKSDYPIVLKNAIENKDWYVARHDKGKNAIYIWNGDAISYTGIPL
ncbi:hypothetical protein [Chitinophaga silvatica]|nr:hypothetical protein [Chitinophaga silvatica]